MFLELDCYFDSRMLGIVVCAIDESGRRDLELVRHRHYQGTGVQEALLRNRRTVKERAVRIPSGDLNLAVDAVLEQLRTLQR